MTYELSDNNTTVNSPTNLITVNEVRSDLDHVLNFEVIPTDTSLE
jgi:hypothetical protein